MTVAPHPASLRQLQYAVAVADTRSFRRAAERCGVLPTPAGEGLIERARRVLVDADDLIDAARRSGDPLAGTLAIGVIPTVSPYLLPAAASAIRRAHPRLTVRWLEDKTEPLARELHAGRLDAALLALEADLGGPLQREVIGRDRFVLATPRSHPLAKPTRPARLGDLRGAPLLLLDDGHCLRDQALAVCGGARAEELAFRATSLPTLAQMVSAGAGITLLPRMAIATESRRADLAVRPLADERAFRTLALVWRPSSPLGPALRRLAATIRASYEKTEAPLPNPLPASRGEGIRGRRRSS